MANIKDLIDKCEDSEIFTQNLDENVLEMNLVLDGKDRKIGIVIWFPKDVF